MSIRVLRTSSVRRTNLDASLRRGHIEDAMSAPRTTHAPAVTLGWLVRLRWGSLVTQMVTLLVGTLALGAPFAVSTVVVVALTAASNVALFVVARRHRPVSMGLLGAVLVFDTVALTALLFLCGGPSNPFSTLYLVYVTLAALALGIRWASVVVAVSAVGYALLFLAGDPTNAMAHMHHDRSAFSAHLQAMWVAFTMTAGLIAYFVARVARALREREEQLPEPVLLDQILEEVRRQTASSANPPPELIVDVDAGVPARLVLPVRGLVQSLRNLLRNAWDAGGPAGDVRLRIRRAEGLVSFEVEDRGTGMASDVLGRVGEPFFTTKPPGKGTGLGLFLARTFAERWHGRLILQSHAGRGTRAALELPLIPGEPNDVA